MRVLRYAAYGAWIFALLLAPAALAQEIPWPRGDSLTVEVSPVRAALDVNPTRLLLEYRLSNARTSAQSAAILLLDLPAPIESIQPPEPTDLWVTGTPTPEDPVASWGAVGGALIPPGGSSDGFQIEARQALPGIVRFWVQGAFDPPTAPRGQEDRVGEAPPIEENSVSGFTVGPVPIPAGASVELLERMGGLLERACNDLAWITNRGICRSLEAKLDAASRSLDRGRTEAARGQLGAFLNELEAQRGQRVNENAYWLLRTNGEFLLERLEAGG